MCTAPTSNELTLPSSAITICLSCKNFHCSSGSSNQDNNFNYYHKSLSAYAQVSSMYWAFELVVSTTRCWRCRRRYMSCENDGRKCGSLHKKLTNPNQTIEQTSNIGLYIILLFSNSWSTCCVLSKSEKSEVHEREARYGCYLLHVSHKAKSRKQKM